MMSDFLDGLRFAQHLPRRFETLLVQPFLRPASEVRREQPLEVALRHAQRACKLTALVAATPGQRLQVLDGTEAVFPGSSAADPCPVDGSGLH